MNLGMKSSYINGRDIKSPNPQQKTQEILQCRGSPNFPSEFLEKAMYVNGWTKQHQANPAFPRKSGRIRSTKSQIKQIQVNLKCLTNGKHGRLVDGFNP